MSLTKLALACITITSICIAQHITIMIDPIGDAKHTGREIDDTFERGITIQCAQHLKHELTKQLPDVNIILTRVPGESLQPMQNASFANRLDVNLYLSIGFYYEPTIPNNIAFFHYLQQPTDTWHKYNSLKIYHMNQAHLININISQQLTKLFAHCFKQKHLNNTFIVQGAFAVPCTPLLGIKAPAVYIETGIRNIDDWKHLIQPLSHCITHVMQHNI